jgi:RNA polymerase sigma-70 factor (ECF subfamily)
LEQKLFERTHGSARVPARLSFGIPDYDAELMVRVKEGDGESFALLVERHRTHVVHFLHRMMQNQALAEDLAQEVFLRVYRSRSYEPTAKFTSWLFRIATNLALNARRDGRNEVGQERLDREAEDRSRRQVADTRPTAEQELLCEVRGEEVRRAVAALPGKQRVAVLMHKYEGMRYAEIAEALACSEKAVKALLFRAHETLRGRLAHLA